jgi:ribosomal protein S18 acetylase RimI-like enzyme
MNSMQEVNVGPKWSGYRERLRIRDYYPSDFEAFYSLYAKVFAEPPWLEGWSPPQVKEEVDGYLLKPRLNFIVAEAPDEKGVVGFSVAYQVTRDASWFPRGVVDLLRKERLPIIYGNELAVSLQYRGIGLGTAMMNERVKALKRALVNGFVLIGRTDKDSKMGPLYKKLGYTNTGFKDPKYETRYYWMKRFENG